MALLWTPACLEKAEFKEWILFSDEADALFVKRGDIRDSHYRYANQEISYLLQRIETYHSLVILATNKRSNLDEAFVRRGRVGGSKFTFNDRTVKSCRTPAAPPFVITEKLQ